MFELGTYKHKLWRSSKNEWFGDTPGFYWGCNNVKDMDVRLETIPSAQARPEKVVFTAKARDLKWQNMYQEYKGKIDVAFAKKAFTSPALATNNASCDAKFTTTGMAKEMKSWAVFGPPTGKTWNPTPTEKERYPEIKALVTNPWTVLGTMAPASDIGTKAPVLAGPTPAGGMMKGKKKGGGGGGGDTVPAWRGTLLPHSDGDIWLALAFADYERLVAVEKAAIKKGDDAAAARTKLDQSVAGLRTNYKNANYDVALAEVKFNTTNDNWYKAASSKGVLLLHELRADVGGAVFDRAMDDFGMKFGGQRVTSEQFRHHMMEATGRQLQPFFDKWLRQKGLPEKQQ